jgi:hypothetical protein
MTTVCPGPLDVTSLSSVVTDGAADTGRLPHEAVAEAERWASEAVSLTRFRDRPS